MKHEYVKEQVGLLPIFPNFCAIKPNLRQAIESYTSYNPPYSDFNFISLWSWDVLGTRGVCQLNGNLVVRMSDYSAGTSSYTFLGKLLLKKTALTLLEYSRAAGEKNALNYVPEEIATTIAGEELSVFEDRDNFDYIYKIPEIPFKSIPELNKISKKSDQFKRKYPNVLFQCGEREVDRIRGEASEFLNRWLFRYKSAQGLGKI